jgi:hypothetical protein
MVDTKIIVNIKISEGKGGVRARSSGISFLIFCYERICHPDRQVCVFRLDARARAHSHPVLDSFIHPHHPRGECWPPNGKT